MPLHLLFVADHDSVQPDGSGGALLQRLYLPHMGDSHLLDTVFGIFHPSASNDDQVCSGTRRVDISGKEIVKLQ